MKIDRTTSSEGQLRLWRGKVLPEWLDYNGHMTEHRYLQVFGESSDALYGKIGVDFNNAGEGAFFTLETHIRHRAEAKVGTALWTETEILGFDERRLHLYHRLFDKTDTLLATGEHLSIHVARSSAVAAPALILAEIERLFVLQKAFPLPEGTGSVLSKMITHHRITL
ncbi:thioesterase family protein [Rhizobium sp. 2YAF20]|uniref:thioesterase family protein n=1 Tax=Rhizobium sp. 2YAF20 TaxID=3233027 RepID=UPI003F990286